MQNDVERQSLCVFECGLIFLFFFSRNCLVVTAIHKKVDNNPRHSMIIIRSWSNCYKMGCQVFLVYGFFLFRKMWLCANEYLVLIASFLNSCHESLSLHISVPFVDGALNNSFQQLGWHIYWLLDLHSNQNFTIKHSMKFQMPLSNRISIWNEKFIRCVHLIEAPR